MTRDKEENIENDLVSSLVFLSTSDDIAKGSPDRCGPQLPPHRTYNASRTPLALLKYY